MEYEDYYGALLNTVEKIATEYHDTAAWRTLVSSIYNDDSPFAQGLAAQPDALPTLLELAHSQEQDTAGRALYVLAEALARCDPMPSDKTCVPVERKRQDILVLLRGALQNPLVSLSAVRGLGLCGEAKDLDLLTQAQPAPRGELSEERNRRYFDAFVLKSQHEIEVRLKQK